MSKTPILKDKALIAKFLNISDRTINRYIKKHQFAIYVFNKQKRLDLKEVFNKLNNYNSGQLGTLLDKFGQFESKFVKKDSVLFDLKNKKTIKDNLGHIRTKSENILSSKEKDNIDKIVESEKNNNVENFLSSIERHSKETTIYKNLYEETLADLKNKQERLEGATYRVGQLEAQLKNSVPLLTYRQKEEEVIHLNETYKKEKEKRKVIVNQLKQEKTDLAVIKNIYVILLFSFLFLTPLFLLYILNK